MRERRRRKEEKSWEGARPKQAMGNDAREDLAGHSNEQRTRDNDN